MNALATNGGAAAGTTLQFLKLGGSLITEKSQPGTVRYAVLARLAAEIWSAFDERPDLRLVLGHGSGSFGHTAAEKYATHLGARTPEAWRGFAEVWYQAARLNHLVVAALVAEGIPAIVFPPSAQVTTDEGQIIAWDLHPLAAALEAGLVPVVYGDVAFDRRRGAAILSTEDLFVHLARRLHPGRILIAGLEPGVWADYPECTRVLAVLSEEEYRQIRTGLRGSSDPDVTGGMENKVAQMLNLAGEERGVEIFIFSGETHGLVKQALLGETFGTLIRSAGSS